MNVMELTSTWGLKLTKKSNTHGGEYSSPCPGCGGKDRFIVHPEKNNRDGAYFCRKCGLYGDNVQFLIDFHKLKFNDAWEKAGRGKYKHRNQNSLTLPPQNTDNWTPNAYKPPTELWQEKANRFLAVGQQEILNQPGALKWLSGRGLSLEAVIKYKLGWNAGERGQDLYRNRESWGLPRETKDNGRPKALWLPIGLIIPHMVGERVLRLRIRRTKEGLIKFPIKYYFLPGSSLKTMIFNHNKDVFVIVESELDAMLIDFLAGDLIGAISIGSLSAKPDEETTEALKNALHIMNALDFEENAVKAKESFNSINWWSEHFQNSERWPVPQGKDPGEAASLGVDIRKWIQEGLPPIKGIAANTNQAKSKKDTLIENLKEGPRELYALLTQTEIAIEYHQEAKGILEPYPCWLTENWEETGKLERLLFHTPEVSIYLADHPAKIITKDNFLYN